MEGQMDINKYTDLLHALKVLAQTDCPAIDKNLVEELSNSLVDYMMEEGDL
jgi:hypothetical protein